MKKILLLFIFLSKANLFNDDSQFDYSTLVKKYSKNLNNINVSANLLFAKILALEIGRQFSSDSSINQDLIICGSKLRQQIDKISNDFARDFAIN